MKSLGNMVDNQEELLVFGGFNARVGCVTLLSLDTTWNLGGRSWERNEQDERLIEFCQRRSRKPSDGSLEGQIGWAR